MVGEFIAHLWYINRKFTYLRNRLVSFNAKNASEMGIKVKLDVVLARRNMTLTQLSERIGVTLANLSILKTGKGKAMRFSTLEAICHELNCQPGDILEYNEEE